LWTPHHNKASFGSLHIMNLVSQDFQPVAWSSKCAR
jgi:hypothetical protein